MRRRNASPIWLARSEAQAEHQEQGNLNLIPATNTGIDKMGHESLAVSHLFYKERITAARAASS